MLLTFLYTELTYEVTCLKRRVSEGDSEADGKVKELERQLKAFLQEKENVGRVSVFAASCCSQDKVILYVA